MSAVSVMKTVYLFGKKIDVAVDLVDAGCLRPEELIMFEKKLEHSDVSVGQSRLFIPEEFLTKEETDNLKSQAMDHENSSSWSSENGKKKKNKKKKARKGIPGMEVEAWDSEGRTYELKLTHWLSLNKFVLNKGWNECVKGNQLHKGDVIRLTCLGRRLRTDVVYDVNNNKIVNNTKVLCFGLDIVCRIRTLPLIQMIQ